MIPCFTCGRRAFTIRGCCRDCDRPRHLAHELAQARMGEAFTAYRVETGCEPFADYDAFEAWLFQWSRWTDREAL